MVLVFLTVCHNVIFSVVFQALYRPLVIVVFTDNYLAVLNGWNPQNVQMLRFKQAY